MSNQLSPRKAPRQSRSQVTVTAVRDATARILIERGFAAASTNAVAERAGVGERFFFYDSGTLYAQLGAVPPEAQR